MRTLEIILLLIATIVPFIKRPLVKRLPANYLVLGIGILLLLHLVFEGWRWQMFPAYLIIVILGWRIKAIDADNPARLSFLRVLGYLGIVVVMFLGWLLPSVLPVFSLPEPTGVYQVGTQMIHVQTDNDEPITKDPNDRRELMLKVWYPSEADVSSMKGERYVDDASRSGFATKYGLPPNALNYLDRVKTYAYPELPVANGTFPVLLFSHGYGSKATGYYALLTEIASQGYVIVNMNHTYESLGSTFPDGTKKYFDYGYQAESNTETMSIIQPLVDAFKDGLDYDTRHPIIREVVKKYVEVDIQDRWASDMIETLDLIEQWNTKGFFRGKFNLEKLGVFGHSVGGGSAGNLAMKDSRIKAAVNLDGIQWGDMIDTTYHVPYLYVSADWPADHEDINSHVYINKSTDYFYETKLLNSGHPNFMDIPFMIPVPALAGTGAIDAGQGMEIVTRLTTAFFDRHVKGLPGANIQAIGEQYDLLEMTVHKGDSIQQTLAER